MNEFASNLLPESSALLALARRVIWFKEPEDASRHIDQLVAYTLTLGTAEDVGVLRSEIGDERLRASLRRAPAGIFDPRSWTYWHLMLDLPPDTPLPRRSL
jgi:hypothetical protein